MKRQRGCFRAVKYHLADLAGEACVGRHVCDGERLVGREVEQTLIESRREEADGRSTVDQSERQQAADVEVQVVMQSWTQTHRRESYYYYYYHYYYYYYYYHYYY